MHKIFISHSSKDKDLVEALIDELLIGTLGIKHAEIVCTSVEGMKIASGSDWRKYLRDKMTDVKVTVLILTPNYKESEICLNEMGAAWALDSFVLPVTVDPINWKTAGILQEPKQLDSLNNETGLDRIRDAIQQELNINSSEIKSDRWTTKKRAFLLRLNASLKATPFPQPIGRKEFETLLKEKRDDASTIDSLTSDNSKLERMIRDLENAKDKTDVAKVKAKYTDHSDWDKFEEHCETVSKLLTQLHPIVCGVVYNTFSNKNIEIRWENYKTELDDAKARDLIDNDDLVADWQTTPFMQKLHTSLQTLSNFMHSRLKDDFFTKFDEEYECPFQLSNLDFWEDVLGAKIYIN